jgi:hypothetical protein
MKKPAKTPCPTVGVATRINYVSDAKVAGEVTTSVKNFFEARQLRYFFYFPAFAVFSIGTFCGVSLLILCVGHMIFKAKRDKKRMKRMSSLNEKIGAGGNHKISDAEVKWPTQAGKGWSIKDYEAEMKAISNLPEESLERLERFAGLFARSLDLIVTALSTNRTIPHAIFKIRDDFAREISRPELEFVLDHVKHLVGVTKREQAKSEELTSTEKSKVEGLVRFFEQ